MRGASIPTCCRGLTPLMPRAEAERMAEAIAAMIDGLYIRRALKDGLPNPASAAALVEDFVETKLQQPRSAQMSSRPNILIVMVDQLNGTLFPGRAGRLPARAASEGACRALGALRQQLHGLAALRARPRRLHERAIAVAHRGSTTTPPSSLPTSRPMRIICAPPATTPACPARCISSGRTSCTASRSG